MSDTTGTQSTTKNAIKVYTLTRAEKISYDYHVPARSLREALEIFNSEEIDEYDFKDYNTHNHITYYAPQKHYQTSLDDFSVYVDVCLDHIEVA